MEHTFKMRTQKDPDKVESSEQEMLPTVFQWVCLYNNIDTGNNNAVPNNAFACMWSEAPGMLLNFENHKAAKPQTGPGSSKSHIPTF